MINISTTKQCPPVYRSIEVSASIFFFFLGGCLVGLTFINCDNNAIAKSKEYAYRGIKSLVIGSLSLL